MGFCCRGRNGTFHIFQIVEATERPQSIITELPTTGTDVRAPKRPIPSLGLPITVPCAPASHPGGDVHSIHSASQSSRTTHSPSRGRSVGPLTPQSAPLPPMARSHSPSPPLTPLPPLPPPIATPLLEMGFSLKHIQKAIAAQGEYSQTTFREITLLAKALLSVEIWYLVFEELMYYLIINL